MQSDEQEIRYTLNGEEPTRSSTLYTNPIVINTPTNLQAKSFRGNLYESSITSASYNFAKEKLYDKKPEKLKKGIFYQYYEHNWYMIPDTINLVPDREGVTDRITTELTTKPNGFIFQFSGYINIKQTGNYTFYLKNDGRCKLFIDDELIINAANIHSTGETSYHVPLAKGYIRILLQYTNYWLQGKELTISYEGLGIERQELPGEVLFYKEKKQ